MDANVVFLSNSDKRMYRTLNMKLILIRNEQIRNIELDLFYIKVANDMAHTYICILNMVNNWIRIKPTCSYHV